MNISLHTVFRHDDNVKHEIVNDVACDPSMTESAHENVWLQCMAHVLFALHVIS